ncbi:MAG: GAF domain-containing protein, partial [Proteobacteria bacterium]
MSFAGLRSVSPIHIEYLKNMGVAASMSISLLSDGELDGLVACHHYAGPLRVPYAVRETCAYLGQALSWQSTALRTAHAAEKARAVRECEAAIMQSVARESDLLDGLATEALTGIAEATGAVVVLQEGSRRVGATPSTEQLTKLVAYLGTREDDTFFTDKLARELPEAAAWSSVASGVLAVTISRELREYLIWFRPMTEQTID